MSDGDFYRERRETWWDRLVDVIAVRRSGGEPSADYLFSNDGPVAVQTIADVPEHIKTQIREEAVLDTFNRLESSLRLLLHATTEGREPESKDQYQQILNVWRFELEQRANLVPDTYCGAVQRYEPAMDEAYIIDGRCGPGDLLLIRVPCWRMYERIVIRGEAEPAGGAAAAAAPEPRKPQRPAWAEEALRKREEELQQKEVTATDESVSGTVDHTASAGAAAAEGTGGRES